MLIKDAGTHARHCFNQEQHVCENEIPRFMPLEGCHPLKLGPYCWQRRRDIRGRLHAVHIVELHLMTTKRVEMTCRMAASLREELEVLAAIHHMTVNRYCVHVLTEHAVRAKGLSQEVSIHKSATQQEKALAAAGV